MKCPSNTTGMCYTLLSDTMNAGADILRAIQSLLVVMALVATASEAIALPEWPWPGVDVPICPMLDERGEGFESLGHLYALDVSDPNPTRKIPQRWCDTVYRVKATEPGCRQLRCVKRGLCDLCGAATIDFYGWHIFSVAAPSGCLHYVCLKQLDPKRILSPR